jgi:hypothetical protein
VLRFLLWRLLGLLAVLAGIALVGWLLAGGPGRVLRGHASAGMSKVALSVIPRLLGGGIHAALGWAPLAGIAVVRLFGVILLAQLMFVAAARWRARRHRCYVRLRVEGHRTDRAAAESVVKMFDVVQFLDSPGTSRGEGEGAGDQADGGDGDGELLGVGADDGELVF